MSTPLRWGVVGLGSFAMDSIVPAITASPGSKLVACSGHSLEQSKVFAGKTGIPKVYASHDELVRDSSIDAVFVATPNALHNPVVIAAARVGKHVFCEKPLSLSVASAQEMVDACRSASVLLRVGFHLRFEDVIGRIRAIVQSGAIGELRALSIERTAPPNQTGAWRHRPELGGGILYDVAVHLLDLVQWVTDDKITEVFARARPHPRAGKANDTVAISGLLGEECNLTIRASRELPYAKNDLVIEGSQGMISTSALRWADEYVLRVTDASGLREEHLKPAPAYHREIEAFEREVGGERTQLARGEEGVQIVAVTVAILEALASDRSVAVTP